MIQTADISKVMRLIQETKDESERLAMLSLLKDYVAEHPDDEDAGNILDKYKVLNQDFTKTLQS